MDLKQLEAFLHVVKLNSFSKAAEAIYLSQPTISAHINSLEKELSAQLVVRSTKEVQPTKAGQDLYVYAKNILALRDQAIEAINGPNRNTTGELSILSSSVPAQYLLPEAITAFRAVYPNIYIHVYQSDSEDVAASLSHNLYDFGIVGTPIAGEKFVQKPFYRDTLVIAYPASLPIKEDYVRENLVSFMREQPVVMREAGSGTRRELIRFLKEYGLTLKDLKPAGYFSNTQGVVHAVASGLGFSFVSKAAVSVYRQMGMVKTVEIAPERFCRMFYLLLKKEMLPSPMQSTFLNFLPEHFQFAEDT